MAGGEMVSIHLGILEFGGPADFLSVEFFMHAWR